MKKSKNKQNISESTEVTTTEQSEQMVDVFESEYYVAKARQANGEKVIPSVMQTSEFGPFEARNMIVRCAGDEDIPVDELAIQEEYLPEHIALIESARAAGVFNQGKGTAEVPGTNGVVYAGIWETAKHDRIIRVLFKRRDGGFTHPIEFDNAIFMVAAQSDFMLTDKATPFYKDVQNFHKKAMTEIINRLPLGEGVNYVDVLKALKLYHDYLPLHELIEDDASIETIYSDILRYVANSNQKYHEATKYFRLNAWDMEQISGGLNMTAKQVCTKLKEFGLLYLTPSSRGFQTKVKYKGVAENYYCVLKYFGKQGVPRYEPTALEDGAQVQHDGTVKMPLNLYQQMFGDAHPSVLNMNGSNGTKRKSKKTSGYEQRDW